MKHPGILLAFVCLAATPLNAASFSEGSAVVDWDRAAWDALAGDIGLARPVLTLNAFFDQDAVSVRNYSQILRDPPTNAIYTGQVYGMNGPVVSNLEGRTSQPTTFTFEPGNPEGHSGVIGLAGISRFGVSGGGSLLYGDYTLQFDTARQARGGSGWYLKGNIPPVAPAFDLLQVHLQENGDLFQLDADLAVTFEIANFLYATPSDALRDVGDFHFTARVATNPGNSPKLRVAQIAKSSLVLIGEGGTPGGTYTLRSASAIHEPETSWRTVGEGTFDSKGSSSNSIPVPVSDLTQWFRLHQP
ncbi:MAG: hypothetical protein JNL10_08790 [Verrucomicrobiales bacterium]|nr:hypothetical protein [Verrucomicrobiales bacterium]